VPISSGPSRHTGNSTRSRAAAGFRLSFSFLQFTITAPIRRRVHRRSDEVFLCHLLSAKRARRFPIAGVKDMLEGDARTEVGPRRKWGPGKGFGPAGPIGQPLQGCRPRSGNFNGKKKCVLRKCRSAFVTSLPPKTGWVLHEGHRPFTGWKFGIPLGRQAKYCETLGRGGGFGAEKSVDDGFGPLVRNSCPVPPTRRFGEGKIRQG